MANFGYVNTLGAGPVGAIVGDTPNPYAASTFAGVAPSNGYLTTGTLAAGDTGEFGNLSEMTVEFWFQTTGSVAANRAMVIGPEVAVGSRQWGFELKSNGTVFFYVRNSVPTLFTATSTTSLQANIWYHVVGAVHDSASLIRLYINGSQEASTAWTGPIHVSTLSATAGDLRVNDPNFEVTTWYDELATYRRFIGATRISAHYTAGTQMGWPLALPGQRIGDVLDDSASVHTPRSLDPGVRQVTESYSAGQPPIAELQRARAADNVDAMLFISRSGVVTYLDSDQRTRAPHNTIQATFGDAGGTELSYLDLDGDYSDSFIANEWNVTRQAGRRLPNGATYGLGETQTVSDATSIGHYFHRPASLADVPVTKDSEAATIATAMLAKYKDPFYRVQSITLSTLDPNVALELFRRELGDKIRVLRTPPGGGSRITQDLYIQKITVSGANDGNPWSVVWGLSPL